MHGGNEARHEEGLRPRRIVAFKSLDHFSWFVDRLAELAIEAVRAYRARPLDAGTVELMADLEHVAKSSR